MNLDELRKKIEDSKLQRNAQKTETDRLLAEIDKLKALLDSTPVYVPPPSTIVRLPNPRPMPEEAVQQIILVAHQRVYFLNKEAYVKAALDEVKKAEKTLLHTTSTPDKPVFDHEKTAKYIEDRRVGSRELKLVTDVVASAARLRIRLEPLPEGGETVEQIKNPASNYQRLLRKLKADPKNVIGFSVYRDSIETYLAAREVADSIGMPATWNINASPFWVENLPGIVVNVLKPAPIPTAPAVPRLTIPPPKAALD